jgi:hypothetical protein
MKEITNVGEKTMGTWSDWRGVTTLGGCYEPYEGHLRVCFGIDWRSLTGGSAKPKNSAQRRYGGPGIL